MTGFFLALRGILRYNKRKRVICMDKIEILKRWIAESNRIVAFTGAGVSTESGIPDFRSVDGLYSQKFEYPPETIISHSFYERNPAYFFRFYREKMLPLGFEPNIAHKTFAKWEAEGRLSAVVTQPPSEGRKPRCP